MRIVAVLAEEVIASAPNGDCVEYRAPVCASSQRILEFPVRTSPGPPYCGLDLKRAARADAVCDACDQRGAHAAVRIEGKPEWAAPDGFPGISAAEEPLSPLTLELEHGERVLAGCA